jgi:hypothetical protein
MKEVKAKAAKGITPKTTTLDQDGFKDDNRWSADGAGFLKAILYTIFRL